jgi:hypothetical protein
MCLRRSFAMSEYEPVKIAIVCLCAVFLVLAVREIYKKIKFFSRRGGYMVGHFADRNGSIRSMRSTAKPHERMTKYIFPD